MAGKNKLELQVEVRDNATKAIRGLRKELESLGGPAMVKAQREAAKLNREVKLLSAEGAAAKPIWTRFTQGIALGNIAAIAATKAFSILTDAVSGSAEALVDATKVAARIEVLNGVMQFTGKQAGYAAGELERNRQAIRDMGIAQEEALSIQQRFIQANLDIGKASDVARVAQNAAVIAGVNSSEAALGITDAIVKQRPILLKQYGIILTLNETYDKMAKTLGKKRAELTATEKRQAFYNEIMIKSTSIAGAYETAMGFAGKRLTSLPRHFQDAQQAVGRHFLPAMNAAITVTENFLKAITFLFGESEEEKSTLEKLGTAFSNTTAKVERLNIAFEDGTVVLESYRSEMAQIMSEVGQTVKDAQDEVVANILENARDTKTAAIMVGKAYEAGYIPAEKLVETQHMVRDAMLEMIATAERAETVYYEPFDPVAFEANRRALLLIEKDAESSVEGVKEVFTNLAQSGVIYESIEAAMADLEGAFGFDPEHVAEFFGNDLKAAVSKAVENITQQDTSIATVKTRISVDWEIEDDDNTYAEMLTDRLVKRTKEELRETDRRITLKRELEAIGFENSLVGLTEYEAERERLLNERDLKYRSYQEKNLLGEAELLETKALLNEEYEIAHGELIARLADESSEKMSAAAEEVTDNTAHIIGTFADGVTQVSDDLSGDMSKAFDRMGQSMVRNLAVKGVHALGELVFAKGAALVAGKALEGAEKSETATTIANTAGKTANSAATGVQAAAAGTLSTAMVAEGVVVKALTAQYIALAAAKAAASLGVTAPLSVAGATTVKTALVPMLLTGFDDPGNDAAAFRHGSDYGREFMAGVKSRWGAPGFARDINNAFPVTPSAAPGGFGGGTIQPIIIKPDIVEWLRSDSGIIEYVEELLSHYGEGANVTFDLPSYNRSITGGRG